MNDDNIKSLGAVRALKQQDNRLWSPIECLTDCIRDIEKGEVHCDKIMVIRIDMRDEKFSVGYNCAQIKASEMLAAMEITKAMLLQEMGYTG